MEFEIWVRGDDGKNYRVNYEWLRQKLGICDIKARLNLLERPLRKKEIIELLRVEGPRTRAFIERHLMNYDHQAFSELLSEEKIFWKKHGTQSVYHLRSDL